MLHELYQYAIDHELAAQPGFKPKKVKAYVSISLDGEFLAVVPRDKDAPMSMRRISALRRTEHGTAIF